MFRRVALAFIGLFCLITTSATWAAEPVAVAESEVASVQTTGSDWMYPVVIAAGAVAGVVATNALTYSVGTIPYWIGITTTAPVVSPAAAAASRIFVITSGVLGAWIADAVYTTAAN